MTLFFSLIACRMENDLDLRGYSHNSGVSHFTAESIFASCDRPQGAPLCDVEGRDDTGDTGDGAIPCHEVDGEGALSFADAFTAGFGVSYDSFRAAPRDFTVLAGLYKYENPSAGTSSRNFPFRRGITGRSLRMFSL